MRFIVIKFPTTPSIDCVGATVTLPLCTCVRTLRNLPKQQDIYTLVFIEEYLCCCYVNNSDKGLKVGIISFQVTDMGIVVEVVEALEGITITADDIRVSSYNNATCRVNSNVCSKCMHCIGVV